VRTAEVQVFPTAEAVGEYVAEQLLDAIAQASRDNRRYLVGLPTGRTPTPVYVAMAARLARRPQRLMHVTLVMMDEYLVQTATGFEYALTPGVPSCHAYTETEIVGAFHRALPDAMHLAPGAVWFPDPSDPAAYDQQIAAAGGIDCFVLASGASDGHVAFNSPGTPIDSITRVVALSEATRRDNLRTFPGLDHLDAVPRFGVSVGIATITAARRALMLAWGADKSASAARMRSAESYDASWPATVIHACADGALLLDATAADAPVSPTTVRADCTDVVSGDSASGDAVGHVAKKCSSDGRRHLL
jgi:glucosamine-6-phosphate deaminase